MRHLVKLADVCESVRYGYTASASSEEIGSRFLRITDIVPDTIKWETVPFCDIDDNDKNRFSLSRDDIVVARTGATVGYAKLIREDINCVFASYLVRFRINSAIACPAFVGRLVESDVYKKFVKSQVGGAAQPNANAQVLGNFEFTLPSRSEQQKIASILSAYDDLIENNNRRIKLLEESARLLYREWFVRLRFPGYEHTRIVDGVPEGWEKKPISELAEVIMGQSPESKFYNEVGEGLPFHQGVSDFGSRFITHSVFSTALNRIADPGDILFSVRAPVGRLNISLDKIVIGRGLSAMHSRGGHQSFLYYQLLAHFFREDMIGGGAIFASVTKKDLLSQAILTPSAKFIRNFEEYSKPVDQQLRYLFLQNQKLKTARDLLLPRLMDGRLAV